MGTEAEYIRRKVPVSEARYRVVKEPTGVSQCGSQERVIDDLYMDRYLHLSWKSPSR